LAVQALEDKIMQLETLSSCNLCGTEKIQVADPVHFLCRCGACGFVFDSPRPTLRALIDFYSKPSQYDEWLSMEAARDELWRRRLQKMQTTRKLGTLLDIGTGIGQFLHAARDCYSEVSGTEVSTTAIAVASQKYGLHLIEGSIEQIDFCDKLYDNISIFHVLEHVLNPRAVIEKCYRLLTPGGILTIAVPNDLLSAKNRRTVFRNRIKKLLKQLKLKQFVNAEIYEIGLPKIELDGSMSEIHVSHFTPVTLQLLLKRCGFEILENSLDPYYVVPDAKKLGYDFRYAYRSLLMRLFGQNTYDTIWMVARKT
jgi:ubiquinone/menaquinone biosynthesis C-methylase UbiE